MSSFAEALRRELDVSSKVRSNVLKIDFIVKSLRNEGNDEEADLIESSVIDESLPVYTLFKALNNSGYAISYSALSNARQRKMQEANNG